MNNTIPIIKISGYKCELRVGNSPLNNTGVVKILLDNDQNLSHIQAKRITDYCSYEGLFNSYTRHLRYEVTKNDMDITKQIYGTRDSRGEGFTESDILR